jgi:hypothetical protein
MSGVGHLGKTVRSLVISFVTTCAFGVGLISIYHVQNSDGLPSELSKAIFFVSVMAVLHGIALLIYVTRPAAAGVNSVEATPAMPGPSSLSGRMVSNTRAITSRVSLVFIIAQHLIVLFFAAAILDGGITLRFVTLSLLAYWSMFGFLLCTRDRRPTRFDVMFLRIGLFPIFILTILMSALMASLTPQ